MIGMIIAPVRASDIITACCVLFNISKDLNEENLCPEDDVDIVPDEPELPRDLPNNVHGEAARRDIIDNFFSWIFIWNPDIYFKHSECNDAKSDF